MRRAVTDADKELRRLQILEAAKSVFATEGFHDASIASVARAAQLSYGSVYSYFDSKEALFHALLEAESTALRADIDEALTATSLESDDALRRGIRTVFEFIDADRDRAALLFRDPPGSSFTRHLGRITNNFVAELTTAIDASQRAGFLRADVTAADAAHMIGLLVSQLALARVDGSSPHTPTEAADVVVRLVLEGLLPRPRD